MPLTTAPIVNTSRSPSTRRRGGSNPAPIVPGVDSTPNAFTFTDVTNATVSTLYESNTITVTGIDAPSSLSVVGGEYSLNGAAYATAPTTVFGGDTVKVRTTSSGSGSTAVNATLTIGGVSDTYTVTTGVAADTTPDAFTFTDVTSATVGTVYVSNTITVGGINAPANLSISGGEYSINGGVYASSNTTVSNGDTVKVRGTSSGSNSTTVNVSLTIGGVGDVYSITTAAAGAALSFTPLAYYDETSVVQSAGAVSQWTDKGPNGLNLVQATGANQPSFQATGLSGGPCISLDGVDDYLKSADGHDFSAQPAMCAFIRILVDAAETYGGVLSMASAAVDDYQLTGYIPLLLGNGANLVSCHRGTPIELAAAYGTDIAFGTTHIAATGVSNVYNHTALTSLGGTIQSTYPFVSSGSLIFGTTWNGAHGRPGMFGKFKVKRLLLTDFVPTAPQLDEIWAWLGASGSSTFMIDEVSNKMVTETGDGMTWTS